MQPFEALVNQDSGDTVFKINGESLFGFNDLIVELNNFYVVSGNPETLFVVGNMTDSQYTKLLKVNEEY